MLWQFSMPASGTAFLAASSCSFFVLQRCKKYIESLQCYILSIHFVQHSKKIMLIKSLLVKKLGSKKITGIQDSWYKSLLVKKLTGNNTCWLKSLLTKKLEI
jgi:hypothetical protein